MSNEWQTPPTRHDLPTGNQPPVQPGYPPPQNPGQGYPPPQNPGQGYPPPQNPGQGYPPPQNPGQGYPPQGYPQQGGYPPQGPPPNDGGYGGPGGGGYGGYPPQGPPPGGGGGKKRVGLIALVLVTIAGLATAGALVFVNRGNDDTASSVAEEATYVIMDEPVVSTQPTFQARDERGPDPFFPLETQLVSFEQERMAAFMADDEAGGTAGADPSPTVNPEDFDVEVPEADIKSGLYGGTAENTCDPERLISFLVNNPYLGEAWAQVQGITFAELPAYIRSLEVRVLAEPVAVLNHGYNTNTKTAYEIDTVLDAGTAVLVDANGDIRTRCYCGNPIKPKPPTGHKPPACILYPAVSVEPGSTRRRLDAPNNVFLTNRQATYEGGTWVEVMWGAGAEQMGWVRRGAIALGRYCKPPIEPPKCALAFDAPVYRTPSSTDPIGVFGARDLVEVEGINPTPGVITPVGGSGARVVSNGRVLVHFAHPRSGGSAWIELDDIDETGDLSLCLPPVVCVQGGPPIAEGGGAVLGLDDGFHLVEVSGRWHLAPSGARDDVLAEVRLLEHGSQQAWFRLGDVVLATQDLSRCVQQPPIVKCKRHGDMLGDNAVLANPTDIFAGLPSLSDPTLTDAERDAAVAQLQTLPINEVVGFAGDVDVLVVGGATPTNGFVQVRIGQTGPTGWVKASLLDGDTCVPEEICAVVNAPVWSEYPMAGFQLPGTPSAEPRLIKLWTAAGLDWGDGIASLADLLGGGPDALTISLLVEIDGFRGWVDLSSADLVGVSAADCDPPPPPPACPSQLVLTGDQVVPPYECCITGNLYTFTGRTRVGTPTLFTTRASVTEFEAVSANGATTWVPEDHLSALAQFAEESGRLPCGDEPEGLCPVPVAVTVVADAEGELCCAVFQIEGGTEFRYIELTGNTREGAGGTEYESIDGEWVPESRIANPELCEQISTIDPECPDGQVELGVGVCCLEGQELVNGDCADPCPSGQIRDNDGICRTPSTPVPTSTPRPVPTSTPRPTGPTPTPTPTSTPECAPGTYFVGDDLCCPNGTERVPGTQSCIEQCTGNEVRGDDGICRTPAQQCPEGQLTLLLECCPSNLEPNGVGQCAERCPSNSVRNANGQCELLGCPAGQQIGPNGQCVAIQCPSGQVYDPILDECRVPDTGPTCNTVIDAAGDCCLASEALDAGGFCAPACPSEPGNPIRDFQGVCCPRELTRVSGALFNPQTGLCEFLA